MRTWGKSVQIAATYIGTVVGAGFASGQEILAFFTSYGPWGTVGILAATGLFVWLGYKMMLYSHQLGTPSYESFNRALFGNILGRVINLIVFATLFGVTTVMLAGSGSVLEEKFGMPYLLGIVFTIVLAYGVLHKGLSQLLAVNSIVVPMMLLFCLLIVNSDQIGSSIPKQLPDTYSFIWKSILYVSYNLATAQSVLVPIGSHIRDVRILRRAAILGGGGLGFMLLVSHAAMLAHWEDVSVLDIPMVFITAQWSEWLQLFFILVLYAEIFTTLISNVYGIAQQLKELFTVKEQTLYLLLFSSSMLFCLIGYTQLLMILYPIFGYLGLATMLRISVRLKGRFLR
jgi:uncharacterized membrane protein YkvI